MNEAQVESALAKSDAAHATRSQYATSTHSSVSNPRSQQVNGVSLTNGKHGTSGKSLLVKELSCYATLFIAGWNDASAGPLIPYIQSHYTLTYSVVALLFVGQAVGFIVAGFANHFMSARLGLGRVITIGALCQATAYIFLIPDWQFVVMPIVYALGGFGMALQDAQANVFVSTLPNIEQRMGYLHGVYGIGALVCPLAATGFVSAGRNFHHFYAISLALAFVNVVILLAGFKFKWRLEDAVTDEANDDRREEIEMGAVGAGQDAKAVNAEKGKANDQVIFKRAMTTPTVWIFSAIIAFYVGAEVSMGGWIVSFVIDERSGGPSAGYVSSGFFGGLTVGRLLLPMLNVRVGERRIVPFYILTCLALEFAIWYADSLVGNAVTVALIGILLGPIYPIVMSLCTQILPRALHVIAIGFIAALGQVGAAVFPFITGALAQKFTTSALQPVMIVLFGVITLLWLAVPKVDKRME